MTVTSFFESEIGGKISIRFKCLGNAKWGIYRPSVGGGRISTLEDAMGINNFSIKVSQNIHKKIFFPEALICCFFTKVQGFAKLLPFF